MIIPDFDASTHTYYVESKPVINVTRALGVITDYSNIPPDRLEIARQEGHDIHRMVELYSKNDLDEGTLPEWLVPRLNAYKKFIVETGFRITHSEVRLYNQDAQYAGTADLFGEIGLRRSVEFANVDVKRSFYAGRAIGLQLAAYVEAAKHCDMPRATRRYALQLRADGSYRLEPFEDRRDFAFFLSCLNVYRLKEEMSK